MQYDRACRDDTPVCRSVLPSGLSFVALLDQHPSARKALMVRVPSGRSVRVQTAEGEEFALPGATDGQVAELKTKRPWDTKVLITLPDDREYQLPLPVGALIWVS